MLTLIEGGRVYAPEPCGVRQVLLADGHVAKVGEIDRGALERLGAEYEVVDARGCIVAPALIDPHVHLLGGSGQTGFATQTPEFFISELVQNGITTVVGTLGASWRAWPSTRTSGGCWRTRPGWERADSDRHVRVDGEKDGGGEAEED